MTANASSETVDPAEVAAAIAANPALAGQIVSAVSDVAADSEVASAVASVPMLPEFPAGFYVGPNGPSANAANIVDRITFAPIWVPRSQDIDQLAVYIQTAGSSGAKIRVGLYADNGFGAPGAALERSAQLDSTTTGLKTVAISRTLSPGLYWVAGVQQAAGCVASGVSAPPHTIAMPSLYWSAPNSSPNGYAFYGYTANAALPDPCPDRDTEHASGTSGYLSPSNQVVTRVLMRVA